MKNNSKFVQYFEKEKLRCLKYYADCVKCERCCRTLPIGRKDKVLCPSCGRYLFKDKRKEFEYRIGILL